MIVELELHIPPNFFESANEKNNYESISERTAKVIISDILGYRFESIRRGDENKNEPDYIVENQGFEITFGLSEENIKVLKGLKKSSEYNLNIKSFFEGIKSSLEKKHKKKPNGYATEETVLIIISLNSFLECYPEFVSNSELSYRGFSAIRNIYLNELYECYNNHITFKNILLIQLMHTQEFALIDVKKYIEKTEDYIERISIKEESLNAFPHCRVTKCIPEKKCEGYFVEYKLSALVYKDNIN